MKSPLLKARQITCKTFNLIDRVFKTHQDEIERILNAVIAVHELINERLEEILKKGGVYDKSGNKRK